MERSHNELCRSSLDERTEIEGNVEMSSGGLHPALEGCQYEMWIAVISNVAALYVAALNETDLCQIVGWRCHRALHDGGRSGQIERAQIRTLKITIVMGKNGGYAEKQACTHALTYHARTHINTALRLVHFNISSRFISKITAIMSNVCYMK